VFGRVVRDIFVRHKGVDNTGESVLQCSRREEMTSVAYRVFWSINGMKRIWPHNPFKKKAIKDWVNDLKIKY